MQRNDQWFPMQAPYAYFHAIVGSNGDAGMEMVDITPVVVVVAVGGGGLACGLTCGQVVVHGDGQHLNYARQLAHYLSTQTLAPKDARTVKEIDTEIYLAPTRTEQFQWLFFVVPSTERA